jgi:hypothetical protein
MPLEDRAADTWEPMIAVADLGGGQWLHAARKAAVTLTSDRDAGDEGSTPTRLMADCRIAFQDADALPTAILLERLRSDPEAAWATTPGANGLTAMRLGNLLREFEIRSDTIRFPTGQAKGYTRARFHRCVEPLLPSAETRRRGSRTSRNTAGQTRYGFHHWYGSSRTNHRRRTNPDQAKRGWYGWYALGPQSCPGAD